jgi:hypothetical protein
MFVTPGNEEGKNEMKIGGMILADRPRSWKNRRTLGYIARVFNFPQSFQQ